MSISSFNRLGDLKPTETFLEIGLGDKMMKGIIDEVGKISVAEKIRVKAKFEEFGNLVEDVIHAVPKNGEIIGSWGVYGYNKIEKLTKCERALAVMYLFHPNLEPSRA